MKKTGLFYWPRKGNVEACAFKIKEHFASNAIDIFCLDEIQDVEFKDYDMIIVGGSTVGADNWEKAMENNLWFNFFEKLGTGNIENKPVALFGLGDQILYPDHFVDGMSELKEEIEKAGAHLIGRWPVDGYEFTDSNSVEENMFLGLALDEDRQPELTETRIKTWLAQIKKEAEF